MLISAVVGWVNEVNAANLLVFDLDVFLFGDRVFKTILNKDFRFVVS